MSGASSAPTSTRVPLNLEIRGITPGDAWALARYEPYTCATVPGASGAPTSGLNVFRALFGARIGTLFEVTAPVISVVAGARFGAAARAETVTCVETLLGAQVPE